MKRLLMIITLCSIIINLCSLTILFDRTKDELAGNADWTIGYSPQWRGGYSEFGQALRDLGHSTQTLQGGSISSSDLQGVDVFVIPEPQEPFSSSERNAILSFVNNGGGLFLIANHVGSDRSNNGWDSPRVYNESLYIGSNFGFEFYDVGSLYVTPTSRFENPRTQITQGLTSVGMYAGSAIEVTASNVQTNVYLRNFNESGMVSLEHGSGRVVAWGDSSPWDDGTGNSGNNLHDGWSDYSNAQWGVNVIHWLAGEDAPETEVNFMNPTYPTNIAVNEAINVSSYITCTQSGVERAFLYWNPGDGFHPILMTNTGSLFSGTIPAQENEGTIQFYIQAMLENNEYGYFPEGAPESLESIAVTSVSNHNDIQALEASFSVYPNPCNFSKDPLTIKTDKQQTIKIYDVKGRLIDQVMISSCKEFSAGSIKALKSGTYIFKSNNHVQKVSIIK
jgi:hypothetical protein